MALYAMPGLASEILGAWPSKTGSIFSPVYGRQDSEKQPVSSPVCGMTIHSLTHMSWALFRACQL
jgi:hypothetical protein